MGLDDLYTYLLEKYGVTMTPKHVAEVTHRHESHIRALCQSGELPAVRIGKRWVIPTAKFASLLEGGPMVSKGKDARRAESLATEQHNGRGMEDEGAYCGVRLHNPDYSLGGWYSHDCARRGRHCVDVGRVSWMRSMAAS